MKVVLLSFVFLYLSIGFAQKKDSCTVYYKTGVYQLSGKQYDKIKKLAQQLNCNKKYKVTIISSADYIGTEVYNYNLAQKRAKFIKENILKDTIFKEFKIINKGKIVSKIKNKDGNLKDRKSTIIFQSLDEENNFKEIHIGKKMVLHNLLFKPGKDILLKKSFPVLDKLVLFLQNNPTVEINIIGHVCCDAGFVKENPKEIVPLSEKHLSTKRANLVYRYLIHKGIDKNRLKYVGFGFQQPLIYPEKTPEDMQKNKRVEIVFTKI